MWKRNGLALAFGGLRYGIADHVFERSFLSQAHK
jgi:hypothetical protein